MRSPSSRRLPVLIAVSIAAIAVIAVLIWLLLPRQAPQSASEESPGGTSEITATPQVVPSDDPNRISATEILAMSPDELQAFVTITPEEAPTPETYAGAFVTVWDSWMNSGGTQQEFDPHANAGRDVYETALAAKYDPIFTEGLFSFTVPVEALTEIHKAVLNGYLSDLGLEDSARLYNARAELQSLELVSTQSDTAFTIRLTIHATDNIEESAGAEAGVVTRKNANGTYTWELSVFTDESGTYKISAFHKI